MSRYVCKRCGWQRVGRPVSWREGMCAWCVWQLWKQGVRVPRDEP